MGPFLIAFFQVEGQDLMLGTFGIFQDVTRDDDDVNLLVEFLLLVVENVVEFRNGAKGYRVRMKGQNGLVPWDRGQGVLDVVKSLAVSEVAEGIVVPAIDMGIEDTG